MKKKILSLVMAAAVCLSAVPVTAVAKTTTTTIIDDDEVNTSTTTGYDDDDDDPDPSCELDKYDLAVYPAKKTIRVGESFSIDIVATDESEWADLEDPEWEELCEENIDSISFRSTKSSVASVNKTTGKVKGKKKGSAVIKTTIELSSGVYVTLKTKVYVTK